MKCRIGAGFWVGLALAWLSSARVVRAGDDELCETVTERSAAEIIVPFGDAEHPELPPQAVRLLAGEAVCLTGDLDAQGRLTNLRLLGPDEQRSGTTLALALERGSTTELLVSHSSQKWLSYRAASIVTAQDIALPTTTTLSVGPGLQAVEVWDRRVHKLLVYGFQLGPPPATVAELRTQVAASRRQRDASKLNLSATLGFWGGERSLRLGALEQALARQGFAPFDRVAIEGGLDLDVTVWRARAGISVGAGGRRSTVHRLSGDELSTWMSEVTFNVGFDVVSHRQFRAFVATGIGVGALSVDRPPGSSVFPDIERSAADRAKFEAGMLPFDVGAEYFFPFARASTSEKWMLQLGTRLGWMEQVGHGAWKTHEQNGRDLQGPPVDLSGFRARLLIGIGAQNGW